MWMTLNGTRSSELYTNEEQSQKAGTMALKHQSQTQIRKIEDQPKESNTVRKKKNKKSNRCKREWEYCLDGINPKVGPYAHYNPINALPFHFAHVYQFDAFDSYRSLYNQPIDLLLLHCYTSYL
jgi:hypothetical protein